MNFRNASSLPSRSRGPPGQDGGINLDAVLDAILAQDPRGRVACETMLTTGMVIVSGEITTTAVVDRDGHRAQVVKRIGYSSDDMGFDWRTCGVMTAIGRQSRISPRGDRRSGPVQRARGRRPRPHVRYACDEKPELMQRVDRVFASACKALRTAAKKAGSRSCAPTARRKSPWATKTACSKRIDTVVLSTQHSRTSPTTI